jgi:hypothetical protein
MALFDFKRPGPELAASIRFEDEVGVYSIGDLINATWINLTNPEPIPNWLQWYRLIARLCTYARLDALPGTCVSVTTWPSRANESRAPAHVFRDVTGDADLGDLLRAVAAVESTRRTLALRLQRAIVRIAEIDERRDVAARSLLERAGIVGLSESAQSRPVIPGILDGDGS